MTLFEWATEQSIRLPPPNDKGAVMVDCLDCLDREALEALRGLEDYAVVARSDTACWLRPRGALPGTRKKK